MPFECYPVVVLKCHAVYMYLPECTRSLQLSRVAIGLPLLQLAAEHFVTSYFTGRPVQPRPKRWDARTSGGSASSAAGLRGGGPHRRRASSAAAAYAVAAATAPRNILILSKF